MNETPLPQDIVEKVRADFDPIIHDEILADLARMRGAESSDRLLRCIVQYAAGDLERYTYACDIAKLDYRDVIVFGEYDRIGNELVRVRNLNEPFTAPQDTPQT
ncbi:MAG: hypothetical protein HZB26_08145 [Candidatus Hydrogenedentes bacterium]|nr:hypothetical protein [Candidatus Hydrogenedentota bacterium]